MSRTYRKTPYDPAGHRHPKTRSERKQLRGIEADVYVNDYTISPSNRVSRSLVSDWDDITASSHYQMDHHQAHELVINT